MKKSKFILGIMAAIAVSTSGIARGAYNYTIDYEDNKNSSYKDLTVNINGDSYPYIIGATGEIANGGTPIYTEEHVHNVVINVDGGSKGSGSYIIAANAHENGAVHGSSTINFYSGYNWGLIGGYVIHEGTGDNLFSTTGGTPLKSTSPVTINVMGGAVDRVQGGSFVSWGEFETWVSTHGGLSAYAVGGDVNINISGDAHIRYEMHGGGSYGSVDGKVTIIFKENARFGTSSTSAEAQADNNIFGGARRRDVYVGSTDITIQDSAEIIGNVYGGGSLSSSGRSIVNGDTKITIKGGAVKQDSDENGSMGTRGNVYGGGQGDLIKGSSLVILEGGAIEGSVYASGEDNTIEGTATVQILGGDWSQTEIYGKTENAEVKGGTELVVGDEGVAYTGELGSIAGFDRVTVAKGSALNLQSGNLFDVAEHNYTITAANLGTEGLAVATVSPDAEVKVDKPITLNFATEGRVLSGRYKIIDATQADAANIDTTTNWDSNNVSVTGQGASFEGLVWDGQTLYLDYVSPAVDAAMAGNWGVFKASQAFTGTLWGNRANACVLSKPAAPAPVTATDEKGNTIASAAPAYTPEGITLAWGTVYGQSARISGVGADYSLYGGAIGVEHHFTSGRSIGAALGYDWGEVSPFGGSKIDQETFHAAVYGRAGIWQMGSNSAVAVDWSAAYGDTTSENDVVSGDWSQDSLQLDARVSYLRKLNDRTTGSLFAGMQYFAADSDTVDGLEVSSMQNLRAEIGAGISYQVNQKATVYGEASLYNDLMRHNPYVTDAGQRFKGTNPGRTGATLNVGVRYDLNADWYVRGGYSFDVAEDSTEHNINAGAVYKF